MKKVKSLSFRKTLINVRYATLPAQEIFGMVGRCGGGYNTVWSDWTPEGRTKREKIMEEFERGINKINGHYTRLEKSIREKGMLNPVIITCGRPLYRKPHHLPPEMRKLDPSKLLLAEGVTGGSRLYVAQKLNIPVPCIINDRVGRFDDCPKIDSKEGALQYFSNKSVDLIYSRTHGIKEKVQKIVEAEHLPPEWYNTDDISKLRGPMWINIMKKYGYDVHLSMAVRELLGLSIGVEPTHTIESERECMHPDASLKTVNTTDGMVFVCQSCSSHWFKTYKEMRK